MTQAFLECIYYQYKPRKHIIVASQETCDEIESKLNKEKWIVGDVVFYEQWSFVPGVTIDQFKEN